MKCHCMEYYGSHHPECPIQQQVDAQTATYSSNVNALENIFSRLRDADSRYVLSVGLTREEIDAAEEPTFGGKGTRRYLTDIEYAAMCNLASAFDALLAERDALSAHDSQCIKDRVSFCEEIEELEAVVERLTAERDAARAEILELHEKVAFLESREVCAAAHDNVETCGYCQRDAARAELKEAVQLLRKNVS